MSIRNPYEHTKREKIVKKWISFIGFDPDCEETFERLKAVYQCYTYKQLATPLIIADYGLGLRGQIMQDRYGLSQMELQTIRDNYNKRRRLYTSLH